MIALTLPGKAIASIFSGPPKPPPLPPPPPPPPTIDNSAAILAEEQAKTREAERKRKGRGALILAGETAPLSAGNLARPQLSGAGSNQLGA